MSVIRGAFAVLIVTWVGVGSFFAARYVWDNLIAEADDPLPPDLEEINADFALPRFEGEILGVFIAPPDVPVPDRYTTFADYCGSEQATSEQVPWEAAGQFALDVKLPDQFKLQQDNLNTGVVACAGKVYAARWSYAATQPSGYQGSLVIARGVFSHFPFDVSAGRVKRIVAGGRSAVLVEPITPDGIGSSAAVVFPETFGVTEIQATGIPLKELLEVAERVGEGTR
jgi:hypothetical protein